MTDQDPNADWWCWTDSEPSTFRCRERHHDVRPFRPGSDPIDLARPDPGSSTSAQLRATQAALAASQADLTRMSDDRDTALENGEAWERQYREARQEARDIRADAELLRERLDDARADLAAANYKLSQLTKREGS